jgi:hypothetical protein
MRDGFCEMLLAGQEVSCVGAGTAIREIVTKSDSKYNIRGG